MTIIGFCNPLLDISVNIKNDSLLKKYNLKNNDIILADETHQDLISDMMHQHPNEIEYTAGGAGLNSLRVAQLMLEKGSCRIVGCIGQDGFADILVEKSEEAGILTSSFQRSRTRPTGHCACLINSHNRSLVAFLEGANDFKVDHLNTIEEEIATASIIYITGFFFAVSPETSFVCSRFDAESFESVFSRIDILIGNSDEFSELLALQLPGCCGLEGGILALTARFPKLSVIITQGSGPILLKVPSKVEVEVLPVPQIPEEDIVDTNGAGDAFVGGLLGSLERGLGLRLGLKVGNFMAQQVIKTSGIKLPSRQGIQGYLDTLLLK